MVVVVVKAVVTSEHERTGSHPSGEGRGTGRVRAQAVVGNRPTSFRRWGGVGV